MNGSDIFVARQKLRLSVKQMADKLGVHRDTYSKWERGVQKIPAVGVTAIRWLVNGKVD
ncbi:helix-turn-helix protein [compost metagenome]